MHTHTHQKKRKKERKGKITSNYLQGYKNSHKKTQQTFKWQQIGQPIRNGQVSRKIKYAKIE